VLDGLLNYDLYFLARVLCMCIYEGIMVFVGGKNKTSFMSFVSFCLFFEKKRWKKYALMEHKLQMGQQK
jgi:hypothetical protein